MSYEQDARDSNSLHEIAMSCNVIKRHASFVGVEADRIFRMPFRFEPACMDELNEAAGVLERALKRIEGAKQILLNKPKLQAAE